MTSDVFLPALGEPVDTESQDREGAHTEDDAHAHIGVAEVGTQFFHVAALFSNQAEQICFQNDIESCDRDDNVDGQPNTPQTYIAHRFPAQIAESRDLLEPEHDRSDKKSGKGVDP